MKSISKNIDLLTGSPWKKVLLFSLPILLATLLGDLYSFVDSFVLGKFVPEYYSGVASADPIILLFTYFMIGLGIGFSSYTSKYFGAKNEERVHLSFVRSITLIVIIEIFVFSIALLLVNPLLKLVNVSEDIDPVVYEAAYWKMIIILSTGFISSINAAIISQLRAIGDGFSPLIITVVSNVVNIVADILMALLMPSKFLKLIGILLATTISNIAALIFIVIYINKKYTIFKFKLNEVIPSLRDSFKYIKTALPVALQWSMIFIGFIAVMGTFVQFDNILSQRAGYIIHDVVNGKTAAATLATYICSIFSSIGTAIMSFTAQNYGAKQNKRIRQGTLQFVLMTFVIYAVINLFTFFVVYKGTGLYLLLDANYVNDNSKYYFVTYYLIISLTVIINGILIVYRHVLQGLQKTIFPFIASLGELLARILVAKVFIKLINPSDLASNESYIMACLTDPIAWLFSFTILVIAGYFYVHSKKFKNSLYQKELRLLEKEK